MQSANGSKSTPVTFRFKNIGPVKEAEMELGDLTIIAGRNNTGKTYLAYTLYGFSENMARMGRRGSSTHFDDLVKTVIKTGQATQPIDRESLNQVRKTMIQRLAKDFSEEVLPDVFSSSEASFEDASLEIVLNDAFPLEIPPQKEGNFSIAYDGSNIVIEQDSIMVNDTSLSILRRTMSIIS